MDTIGLDGKRLIQYLEIVDKVGIDADPAGHWGQPAWNQWAIKGNPFFWHVYDEIRHGLGQCYQVWLLLGALVNLPSAILIAQR